MEPEISRRCSYCGASVRARAFFCPHCGEELGHKDANGEAQTEPLRPAEHQVTKDATEIEGDGSLTERKAIPTGVGEFTTQPLEALEHRIGHPTYNVGQSEQDALADVHGVEKLRQISGAVLDEASYDPSVRFVLVAAVLFVLFLVIVIASELIT